MWLVQVCVRVKCTVTERGRMVNLKQAGYRPLRVAGRARAMPRGAGQGGVAGPVFLGLAGPVVDREVPVDSATPTSRHTTDMKFSEASAWSVSAIIQLSVLMKYFARFCSVAGYNCTKLVGVSLYDLIHAADIGPVTAAFRNCECRYF